MIEISRQLQWRLLSVLCTFGAAIWRFRIYSSLHNIHP